jgi:hypothetical protein
VKLKLIKYVMIDHVKPILFVGVDHKTMLPMGNITSAGFVTGMSGRISTGGESFSLKGMKPAAEDAAIIERFMIDGGLLGAISEVRP